MKIENQRPACAESSEDRTGNIFLFENIYFNRKYFCSISVQLSNLVQLRN